MTDGFIINPESISQSDALEDLIKYGQSLPDYDQWSLFFNSNGGKQYLQYLAGMFAMLRFEATMSRREAYSQFAINRSSVIAGAMENGYSAFRGRNAIVSITYTPSYSGILPKYHSLGSVKDRELILLEETAVNSGQSITVEVAVGMVEEQEIISNTDTLAVFRFTNKSVSEDLRIQIDDVDVEYSYDAKDMVDGKFALLSNPFGSVDARYLNLISFQNRYTQGSVIKLQWIELKDTDFVPSDVSLDEAEGILDGDVTILSLYEQPEVETSIKVNSPLKREIGNAIRGRKDQPNQFKSIDPSVIDAHGEDVSASVMNVYLLKSDGTTFSPEEKDDLQDKLEPFRPFGFLPPIIKDAIRSPLTLAVDIYRQPNTSGDPVSRVNEVTAQYENKLGQSLALHDIEQELEQSDFIKVARVRLTGNTYEVNKSYELGQVVKASPDNGFVYKVDSIIYFSGSTEPTWPEFNGHEIEDNGLLWKARIKSDVTEVQPWSSDTEFKLGAKVKPSVENGFMYEVVDYLSRSGNTEPTWPELAGRDPSDMKGETKIDADILWVAKPLEGNPQTWSANAIYKTGDTIVATDPSGSDTDGVMFQAFSYAGQTGPNLPTFPTTIGQSFYSGRVTLVCLDPRSVEPFESKDSQYYKITNQVAVN